MLLKYGLIYYSCAETFAFLIHCVECRRAMLGIFLDQACSIIPSGSLPSPKMSSLVPNSHPQSPFPYSMPPGFSCAERLVFKGECRVLPWPVQCMLLCQPRMEEKYQINQWPRERTGVDERRHRSYARYYGQRLKYRCEEHVNPGSLGTIMLSLPVIYSRSGPRILMVYTARCCPIPSELLLGTQVLHAVHGQGQY